MRYGIFLHGVAQDPAGALFRMTTILILDPYPTSAHKALAGLQAVLAFVPSVSQLGPALQRLKPDLLICDVSASEVSGRAIAEQAHRLSPGTRVLFTGPPICRLQALRLIEQKLVSAFFPKPWQLIAAPDVIASLLPHAGERVKAAAERTLKQTATRRFRAGKRPAPVSETEDLDGRYRLDEKLGEGGAGCVYRAHDLLLDMQIAIKLLHPALYRNAQALGDLQSEARICMTLTHPNIVRLYNLDKRSSHYLLVMEYIDGPNLHTLIQSNPTPEPALFRGVIQAVAAALDEAHRSGVTHSDLTPGNILINSSGVPKIIDFGIAALANQQAAPGELIAGTPSYMSPEQLRGEPVGPATDIFALGVIAYQMLANFLPQMADATLDDLANQPRPPLVGISEAAAAVIGRALAFDPADRWPTAGAFADALLQT
jgi:tRNA A-37 threonylcarbamoyl transferase component Bud32/CheY-like chemotaxis protein